MYQKEVLIKQVGINQKVNSKSLSKKLKINQKRFKENKH